MYYKGLLQVYAPISVQQRFNYTGDLSNAQKKPVVKNDSETDSPSQLICLAIYAVQTP